jgi:hypothetical protein
MPLSDPLPFNRTSIDKVRLLCPGVYVFWFGRVCIYVGKTDRSIRERLREHWGVCHNDQLRRWIKAYGPKLYFQWQCINELEVSRTVEQMYIEKFGPLTNKIDAEKKA